MQDERVKISEKIGYGFGDMASSMFWKIFSIYLPIFYTDVFGIDAGVAAMMFLVTRFWDTANDPIMGVICDRTKSRWGKFRPYLLWMAIPFALVGVLLFSAPDMGENGKIVYAYITYTLMMMVYTAINVPYAGLLGVMTSNSDERTAFASYRMVFAFGGSLLVVAMYQPLLDFFDKTFELSVSYQLTMTVIGLLAAMLFIGTFLLVKERIKPIMTQTNNLKEDLKNLMRNVPWRILLASGVATLIFNSVRDGATLYYFKYYIIDEVAVTLSASTFTLSTLYLFLGQTTNMLGVMAAKPVSSVLGKRKTFIYAMLAAGILSFAFFFCTKENIILIYLLQALISFCAGIIFPMLWSMYADTADYSEWKTGRRATGLVFSASSMSQKLGWTIGGSTALWVLAFYGFEKNMEQAPETINGIKYVMSFIPGAFALLSAAIMVFYKLTEGKMKTVMSDLQTRRDI